MDKEDTVARLEAILRAYKAADHPEVEAELFRLLTREAGGPAEVATDARHASSTPRAVGRRARH